MDETNAHALQAIETALFVLVFDDLAPATVEEMARIAAHRHGKALWFDKNFNMIISANARCMSNVDHTWADAPVMVHMYDFVFSGESSVDHYVKQQFENPALPRPERLEWQLTDEFRAQIDVAQQHLLGLTQAGQINVLKFQHYGKGLVKRANMSPDAYVQAALQLAWHRLTGKCALTYESGGTVRFAYGRTETVRSLSADTKRFCELMADANASAKDRYDALRASVKQCTRYMRKATNGDGVDRHLLGLKILALGAGMPLPAIFTDKAYQLPFSSRRARPRRTRRSAAAFSRSAAARPASRASAPATSSTRSACGFTSPPTPASTITADAYAESLNKALLDMRDLTLTAVQSLDDDFSKREFRIQRSE
jgi:carnitine O-acetyltransferase